MQAFVDVLNALAPIVGVLLGTGLFVKYVPFMSKVSNMLIPLLNAIIAFFTVFAPPAHASIFGGIASDLGILGRTLGSLVLAVVASSIYDRFGRPVMDKIGVKKA